MRFCCKQWSVVVRVQCDTGNFHFFLVTAAKFGDSLRNNKRNALRADHFRPSVRTSVRYLVSATKPLLAFHEIWCRNSLQRAVKRAWIWRRWTLGRAFCCNDMHRGTLSHFESKERLRKVTKCATSSFVPRTGRRCWPPNHLIAFSVASCTAGVPFLAGDEFLGAFAELLKVTISFVMSVRLSVRQHGTTRLPLDGFLLNLIFEDFSKICRENSSFVKIWQE